jgi:hypothetical protein
MPWQDFEIVGFMPDRAQNIAGCLFNSTDGTQTYGIYPTKKGFKAGPFPESQSTVGGTSGALDSLSLGSAIVYKTAGTTRVFIGTAAKLWEWDSATTITDRSDTAYSATATNSWSFTQFGDITLAVNPGNIIRQINSGAAFAAVGAAPTPKASIIVTCGPVSAPFVMAFDYDDGTNQYRDGWFNSGISDATSGVAAWTTGTNGCANGRLLDDLPGPILAAIPYRDGVLAWKQRGMYRGSYGTALATGWSWERVSSDIGCLGKNMCVRLEDSIYWADMNGLWQYDGSFPRRMNGDVHQWWSKQARNVISSSNRHLARTVWDARRRNLWFMLPSLGTSNTNNTGGLVYHLDSQLWAPTFEMANTGGTVKVYDFIGLYDSGLYGAAVLADKKMGLVNYGSASGATGGPAASVMTFGVIGDNINTPLCTGFRPLILDSALTTTTIAQMVVYSGATWREDMTGLTNTTTFTVNGAQLWYDGKASDRFLQLALQFTAGNEVEIAAKGCKINLGGAGKQ